MTAGPLTFSGEIYGDRIVACVSCQSQDVYAWAQKSFAYSRARSAEAFTINKCRTCGTGYLSPPPSAAYLSSIYAFSGHGLTAPVTAEEILAGERRFPNSTVDAERLVRIGSSFDKSGVAASLDVGSGMGFITREMRRQGREPVSINPGQYENSVFEELNGYAPFVGMLDDYEPDRQFGLIVLSQVLEHILNPRTVIERLTSMLAPGGVLALAVPNFNSAAVAVLGTRENGCLWVPEHVNYFTKAGLRNLVTLAELEVVKEVQLTRIRYDALARRVPVAKGLSQALVKYGQIPIALSVNSIGRGLHLNIYARKPI